jgi:uncharacterized protein with GYD domain
VKTFVMMTKLAASDAHLVEVGSRMQGHARQGRAWIEQIKERCPEVKFKAHYALLGYWDYMDIYEAPDDETAAKVSIISRSHGAHQVESWIAIPAERILKLTEDISGE